MCLPNQLKPSDFDVSLLSDDEVIEEQSDEDLSNSISDDESSSDSSIGNNLINTFNNVSFVECKIISIPFE